MGSNNGFTIITVKYSQSRGLQWFLQYVRKAHIHNPFAERALQQFLQYSHRYTAPCSSSLLFFTIYTGEFR